MHENVRGSIIYTVIKIKQPKCPVIGKYLSDVIYSLITIVCSHLNSIYINNGRFILMWMNEKGEMDYRFVFTE